MTEDVYKQLAASYGSQLCLRLRCHSNLSVARHYGHLSPDAEVANLFHLAGCHAHTPVEDKAGQRPPARLKAQAADWPRLTDARGSPEARSGAELPCFHRRSTRRWASTSSSPLARAL